MAVVVRARVDMILRPAGMKYQVSVLFENYVIVEGGEHTFIGEALDSAISSANTTPPDGTSDENRDLHARLITLSLGLLNTMRGVLAKESPKVSS